MKQELPSPDDILTELAEGVVAQIDARAVASFEKSLDEMTAYHRFLIAAYSGETLSFAELEETYLPIHREWLRPYRQIIERSIAMLDDEPSFFSTICYLPHKLSRGRTERSSSKMQHAIMELASLIVFRLEKRFTKKASLLGIPTETGVTLKGSDRSTHEDAIFDFVGAWEGFRYWGEMERSDDSPDIRWRAVARSWEFLGEHLALTADVFATAVWNGDVLAAARFRDMLIRWRDTLGLGVNRPYFLRQPEFLKIDLIHTEWPEVLLQVKPDTAGFPDDQFTPEGLYMALVESVHKQTLVTTAGVLVRWVLANKAGDFALSEVAALLHGKIIDDEDVRLGHNHGLAEFPEFWRQLVAMSLAGSYYEGGQHSGFLDHLATSLDRVSERKVTTGRGFTPSTVHDRSGLSSAFWIIARAQLSTPAPRTMEWTQDLLKGDRSDQHRQAAKRLKRYLRELSSVALPDETALPVIASIRTREVSEVGTDFVDFLRDLEQFADELERAKITSAVVDPDVLARIRKMVWQALPTAKASLFEGETYTFGTGGPLNFKRRFAMDKSSLLEVGNDGPQIGTLIAKTMADAFGPHPWWEFTKLGRPTRKSRWHPSKKGFWSLALKLAGTLPGNISIWLPQVHIDAFEAAFPEAQRDIAGVAPAHDLAQVRERAGYAFTLGSLHVFGHNDQTDEAILFSRSSLSEVEFGSEADKCVQLTLLPSEEGPLRVVLECSVAYRLGWSGNKSYRITYKADA